MSRLHDPILRAKIARRTGQHKSETYFTTPNVKVVVECMG
jgi:hypothetical protein